MNKKQIALTVAYFSLCLASLSYGLGAEWQKALAICLGVLFGLAIFVGYVKLMDRLK